LTTTNVTPHRSEHSASDKSARNRRVIANGSQEEEEPESVVRENIDINS
jgi:hypothetical protein